MTHTNVFRFSVPAIALIFSAAAAFAQTPTTQPTSAPAIDPVADQVLREATQFLAQTPAFTVHAEIWKDQVLPSGHKIQVTRQEEMEVRRPDRLHVEQHAHHRRRSIWYDGKSVTVLDRESQMYGAAEAPSNIDQTLDMLAADYDITVPLEDLAVTDPYQSAMKNVTAGGYFGDETVLGVPCRHIGFSTDRIDWQLWVEAGEQPLPRKIVITYKNESQSPQYIAILSNWSLRNRASDLAFQFVPPRGSQQVTLASVRANEKSHSNNNQPQVQHEPAH